MWKIFSNCLCVYFWDEKRCTWYEDLRFWVGIVINDHELLTISLNWDLVEFPSCLHIFGVHYYGFVAFLGAEDTNLRFVFLVFFFISTNLFLIVCCVGASKHGFLFLNEWLLLQVWDFLVYVWKFVYKSSALASSYDTFLCWSLWYAFL